MLPPRFSRGKSERCRSSREQWLHPEGNNHLGAGCAADLGSLNRWSAVDKPTGLSKKRKSGRMRETAILAQDWKKALKGEAHECGELKEASTGRKPNTVERVAKPCGRDFWKTWQRLPNDR
jgi:hypothetical protein